MMKGSTWCYIGLETCVGEWLYRSTIMVNGIIKRIDSIVEMKNKLLWQSDQLCALDAKQLDVRSVSSAVIIVARLSFRRILNRVGAA